MINISSYIQQAQVHNVPEIHQIFIDVTKWLRSMGVLQWDFTYPDLKTIEQDVVSKSCLLVKIYEEIAAVVSINQDQDPQYKNITWEGGDRNIWVIHRLAVNPKFQNQGIATQFCKYIEELAINKGAKAIRLDAYSENPYSNRMYLKLGYVRREELLYFHDNPVGFYAYEKVV